MANLTTADTVRKYLGVAGNEVDAILTRLIAAVSAEIEAWCNQPIASRAVVHTFRMAPGQSPYRLPFFPVTAVASLTYLAGIGEDAVTVDADTYELGVAAGGYFLRGSLAEGHDYTVSVTVGYADVPADVEQVAIEMIAVRLRESGFAGEGQKLLGVRSKSESSGGVITKSTVYERPDWQARLAHYRAVTI